MGDETPRDPWTDLEGQVAEIGILAGEAERYRSIRAGEGPALLNQSLALAATARNLYRHRPSDVGATTTLTVELRAIADRYRSLLQAARAAPAYRQAVAAWQAGDASTLRLAIPGVFADVELLPGTDPLYYPVAVTRRSRLVPVSELADLIAALSGDGIPAGEPGSTPATDDALQAIVLYDSWSALDTPVALRLDGTTIALPLFRLGTSGELLIYTERLIASTRPLLARSAARDRWPDMGTDYGEFRLALTKALTERLCAPTLLDP